MVHFLVLCKLNNDVTEATVEEMAREAQSQLLKIPEVRSVRAGRGVDGRAEYPFYYAVDVDSTAKLQRFLDDPVRIRFVEKFVKPNTWNQLELRYELEPGRDVRFS